MDWVRWDADGTFTVSTSGKVQAGLSREGAVEAIAGHFDRVRDWRGRYWAESLVRAAEAGGDRQFNWRRGTGTQGHTVEWDPQMEPPEALSYATAHVPRDYRNNPSRSRGGVDSHLDRRDPSAAVNPPNAPPP